jgi:hypothetical protein
VKTVYLVACAAKKRSSELPAEELYCSDLFGKARAYVRRKVNTGDEWYILSAKHGLLHPRKKIGPYNETLNHMRKPARLQWASRVMNELTKAVRSGDTIVFLAGQRYRDLLEPEVVALGCQIRIPMRGMPIGKQLQWLGYTERP